MKRTVLIFGLISGTLMAAMMFGTLPFMDKIGFDRGEIIGYTSMVVAFLLVFFGIRSYRENVGGGYITFGRALAVGLLITAISTAMYVAAWEIIYFKIAPDFGEKYTAYYINKLKATGISQADLNTQIEKMNEFKQLYANPVFNVLITFLEPLPVGLIITLISALILRKRRPAGEVSGPAPGEFAKPAGSF